MAAVVNVWLHIVGVAAGVTVLTVTWHKAIVPGWRTVRTTVQVIAALLGIATEYPSKNGSSLGKAIRSIESEVSAIKSDVSAINGNVNTLTKQLEQFILDRKHNGKRHTDL